MTNKRGPDPRTLPRVRDRRDVEAELMAAAADPRAVIQALETQLKMPEEPPPEVTARGRTPAAKTARDGS